MRAPVDGVIASAHAVVGQVLDAREQVFEVVDPARLRIEALAYDPAQAQDVAGASLALPGGQSGHPLSPFWGAGHEDWVHGRPTPFLPGPATHTLRLQPATR